VIKRLTQCSRNVEQFHGRGAKNSAKTPPKKRNCWPQSSNLQDKQIMHHLARSHVEYIWLMTHSWLFFWILESQGQSFLELLVSCSPRNILWSLSFQSTSISNIKITNIYIYINGGCTRSKSCFENRNYPSVARVLLQGQNFHSSKASESLVWNLKFHVENKAVQTI